MLVLVSVINAVETNVPWPPNIRPFSTSDGAPFRPTQNGKIKILLHRRLFNLQDNHPAVVVLAR
jgi:hypothetical protein